MQVVGGPSGVEARPQEIHDPLPVHPVPGLEGEQLDQAHALLETPILTLYGAGTGGKPEAAQHPDAQRPGISVSSLHQAQMLLALALSLFL